jgi:hypothetical protein
MDISDYPSLPNISQLLARLAVNNHRVLDVVDGQFNSAQRLFDATIAHDWHQVEKVCRYLADHTIDPGLAQTARKVCDELSQGPPDSHGPPHLAQLLAECRTLQQQRRS